MNTENTNYIYKNDLDKACFQHDMTSDFEDLAKRTQPNKVLRVKFFEITSNPNMMVVKGNQLRRFASFLIKNLQEVVLKMKLNKINKLQMNFIN